MAQYAANTDVTSEKSQAEIRRTIQRYGAKQYAYMEDDTRAVIAFVAHERQVRFILPLPSRDEKRFTHHSRGPRTPSAAEAEYEQAVRQKWRALNLVIKAKLEAVESGIAQFDQEMYGYVVLPNGRTIYEETHEQVDVAISTGVVRSLMIES